MRLTKSYLLAAALVLAACTATAPPPPMVAPQGEDRYLIDPRTGFTAPLPPPAAQQLENAWRYALAGDEAEAQRSLSELRTRAPGLEPATLIEAFLAIRGGRYDEARQLLARVDAESLVARVYQAEIAYRQRETRIAYDLYRNLAVQPDAPATARERLTELEGLLFNELYASAQSAAPAEAVRLLREALAFNAGAIEPRILLSQKLVEQRQFEEARRELEPLLNSAPDRPEVQEILAEVDIGHGRYQEAIVRYDRLARRTKDPRHAQRLDQIKNEWSAANMPAHYRAAAASQAVTRSDFAVLLYWTVPSVRFAQNLGTPQIAVDIEDVAGREEIIRALALGLYDVDPVTRRVSPHRTLTASRVSSLLSRVLVLRGAGCARGAAPVLGACGVKDPLATYAPEAAVTGADVRAALEQVAKQL
ncbi:MAG TPA: tetratricopeptide repeat protein [Thermoanaerobaculia bacterium]|nr:tetratricopeptide repeat protein [Thermoanaerobaculia bacterium]